MDKLVLLILLIGVLIFPIYENSQIKIKSIKKLKKNIPISVISDAKFFIYKINLVKKGEFKTFEIYKNLYIAKKILIQDLEKNEKFFAKKALFKDNLLTFFDFKYQGNQYNLISDYVIYNIKLKTIKGKKFFVYSKDYNGSGSSFFIDRQRDIKAKNISFYLKVNR